VGLSAREQRALESVQARLAGSDPALARMLTTFSWLTAEEDMPAWERIRVNRRWYGYTSRKLGHHRRVTTPRRVILVQTLGAQRVALLLWLLITIGLITVALTVNRGSSEAACTVPSVFTGGRVCSAPNPGQVTPENTISVVPRQEIGRGQNGWRLNDDR